MLTKSVIDRAKPATKPYIVWDDELAGFGCKVFPSGKRSFVVRYRLRGSLKSYQPNIGVYGSMTVAQARAEARVMLNAAKLGQDPQAKTKARRTAETAAASVFTVAKLVDQYADSLRAGGAVTKRLRGRHATPAYIKDAILHLSRFAAVCGDQDAGGVTRGDVVRALSGHIKQPSAHRRMHGAISRMYFWALKADLVTANPADHVETTTAPARERVLTLEELARIWRAAEQLEHVYRDAVHLMVITGQRRAEVAGMTWGEIDLVRGLWTLPAARVKARRQHVLPLAPLAVATLQARRGAFQREPAAKDLVLPTIARDGKGIAPISGWNWLKRELDRRSGVTEWRLHDFRRSIVSICAEHGADIAVLDSLLNHASSATRGGVIGTYQRALLIEPTRKVMALWDELLREAIGLPPAVPAKPRLVTVA
jgi:integrase